MLDGERSFANSESPKIMRGAYAPRDGPWLWRGGGASDTLSGRYRPVITPLPHPSRIAMTVCRPRESLYRCMIICELHVSVCERHIFWSLLIHVHVCARHVSMCYDLLYAPLYCTHLPNVGCTI